MKSWRPESGGDDRKHESGQANQPNGNSHYFYEHVMHAVVNLCQRIIVLEDGALLSEGAGKGNERGTRHKGISGRRVQTC